MSTFGDDFSESSYEGSSSASGRDEPPTLDETLLDNSLFVMFLNYMKSQQAVGNLMFLKDARKFRMINEPHDIVVRQAAKIILTYFSSASEFPVTLSEDVKKALIDYAFDPSVELRLDKNTFSVAFSEVYNSVVPHFRNWITTEEWREAVPFHRLPPPNFSVVLTSSALRFVFNKFLKSQLDNEEDKAAVHAFHLWKFCLIANDFRDGKYTHESHLESKKKKGEAGGDGGSSERSKKEEGDKKENPEEYAKRVYKKFKHQISLPYDKTMPYAVFIIRSLDQAIEEFDKSALFARWIALKQYQGVDYQAKIMHQSLTPEGYAEPPSLAAALTSSILPAFLAILQGTEQGLNVEFLTSALIFHRKFAVLESDGGSALKSQGSTSSSSVTRKDMMDEAKRIFTKFLESGDMYCDPGLVEEVRTLINKNGGKGINPKMFRKIGAFIYHRSEHTWIREARATYEWVNRNYDNRSRNTRAVLEEFSMSNLPEGFDLQIVPSLDDIYSNNVLFGDYSRFVDEQADKIFEKFTVPFAQYFKTPIRERKPVLEKLMSVFVEATELYPELKPPCSLITKEVAARDRVSDVIVRSILGAVARAGAARFYKKWIVEHSMIWKTANWTSATEIKYGDLSLIMGMSAVESKIEEAALKGKSGFSRYLAKRQLKKQSIAAVRSTVNANAQQQKQDKTDPAAETAPAQKEEEKTVKKEVDVSTAATVPTLDEILSSLYLRKFFERSIIDAVLNPEQKKLWEAFSAFFKRYDNMSNEQVSDSQEQMLKDIIEMCDRFKDVMPNSEQVKERAKKQKFLFPIFFRPEEHLCYAKIYVVFEAAIRKRGWKSPQN